MGPVLLWVLFYLDGSFSCTIQLAKQPSKQKEKCSALFFEELGKRQIRKRLPVESGLRGEFRKDP